MTTPGSDTVRDGTRLDTDVDFKPNREYRPAMPLLPGSGAFEGLAQMADQPPGLSPAEAAPGGSTAMQLAKLIPDEAAAYHDQVVTALRRAFGTA